MSTAKPITKALHTVRVFKVLAVQVRLQSRPHGGDFGAESVYRAVLDLLGNADTTDATLRAALIEACRTGGQS